jgi:hypothetical protein
MNERKKQKDNCNQMKIAQQETVTGRGRGRKGGEKRRGVCERRDFRVYNQNTFQSFFPSNRQQHFFYLYSFFISSYDQQQTNNFDKKTYT